MEAYIMLNRFIKRGISQFWNYEVAEPPLKNTATPFHIFPSYLSSLCKAAKRRPPIEPQLLVSIYNEFS